MSLQNASRRLHRTPFRLDAVAGSGWSESLSPVHDDPSSLDHQAEIGGGVGHNADVVQGVAVDEDEVSMRSGLDHTDLA